jgi:hypothetical protein
MSRLEAAETTAAGPPPPPPKSAARQILTWVGLLAVVVTAVLGSNMFSLRDRLFGTATPNAARPAESRVVGDQTQPSVAAAPTSLRSSPWWQDVTTLDGSGSTTSAPFTIGSGALQWRVTATCTSGHLTVKSPKEAKPVIDGACPAGGVGYSIGTGSTTLAVTADGAWHLAVAQQVDVPLVEPPLAAMTSAGASAAATGAFYNIDKTGTGKVTVYHQADGKYSLRLDDFFVSPNTELELRFSSVDAPHSSTEFANGQSEVVATMDVTAGSLNFQVPPTIDPTKYRSVVVWCVAVKSAYAAATLGPAK